LHSQRSLPYFREQQIPQFRHRFDHIRALPIILQASCVDIYPRKSPQAYFLSGCWWRVSAITVYHEKCLPCPPESYAVPLLKHGCAELASAQHTIPTKRVFHQLKVIGRSRSYGSIPKNRRRRIFLPGCWWRASVEILLRKTQT